MQTCPARPWAGGWGAERRRLPAYVGGDDERWTDLGESGTHRVRRANLSTTASSGGQLDVGQQSRGSGAERQLQELLGTTARAEHFHRTQVLDHLNDGMQTFIARQQMAFIATADAHGACGCSLRAGPAGFVRVLDAQTLAFPEYRGNGVRRARRTSAEAATWRCCSSTSPGT